VTEPRSIYALEPWLLPPVVWGGTELQRRFGKKAAPEVRLGESWEVSCVPGRPSTIAGTSETLADAFTAHREHFVGPGADPEAPFPLLVKLLATAAPLSVQVHPDDAQARRLESGSVGKHEAWVVLAAGPRAEVRAGLRAGKSASDLFGAAAAGDASTVRDLLAAHHVVEGDVVEIPPGCVHAPGPDLVLYEVQQPADLTYRVFDWGRVGLDGRPRELHVEKARQVLDASARPVVTRAGAGRDDGDVPFTRTRLVATRPFVVERWSVSGAANVPTGRLLILTCTNGRGAIDAGGERVTLARGSSCVVPAAVLAVDLSGQDCAILVATPSCRPPPGSACTSSSRVPASRAAASAKT
jgi:mannose-6-phosphate isomerase